MLFLEIVIAVNRLRRLGITLGTSGHSVQQGTPASLLACIKIICDEDFTSGSKHIGSGRFGACYLHILCHCQLCVKKFKCSVPTVLIAYLSSNSV